ncbi:MAG TPA: winged helix-turn-helix domain-containing protein [Flavobacterium sp.]|nr:winged helix-turn-helix domain-containing protein [Flavobacterium sp.]
MKAFFKSAAPVYGLLAVILCLAFGYACMRLGSAKENFMESRQEIMLRQIGHRLLLHTGDTSSRVLPIKRTGNNEYQIQFARKLIFQPDSLVAIVEKSFKEADVHIPHVVNVLDCATAEIVYGYSIAREEDTKNIIPCTGRIMPESCYLINIKFEESGNGLQIACFTGGVLLLGILLVVKARRRRPYKIQVQNPINAIALGSFIFDAVNKSLVVNNETIKLTSKECGLLLLFSQSPNQMVDRSLLQKELWENEGIIVGRSLDVYISRLRKKFEKDSSVRIINIHGRGYKLEISKN